MGSKPRRWWRVIKALLSLAIVLAVGWRFAADLARPELYDRPLSAGWLVAAVALYLAGLSLFALYWRRLLVHLGGSPGVAACLRAYFVSQLGKYMPGKAWGLVLRVGLIRGPSVTAASAGLTTFAEVLTMMGVGALVAAGLFALFAAPAAAGPEALRGLLRLDWPDKESVGRWVLVAVSLAFAAVTLGPIFPPVFNGLAGRLAVPFRTGMPLRLRTACFFEGFFWVVPAWLLLGISVACTFAAVGGAELPWAVPTLARLTAALALSYVAGFLLFTPGGLGVREFFLGLLLAPELALHHGESHGAARGRVALVVVLLRLVWTGAELLAAAGLYGVPAVRAEAV